MLPVVEMLQRIRGRLKILGHRVVLVVVTMAVLLVGGYHGYGIYQHRVAIALFGGAQQVPPGVRGTLKISSYGGRERSNPLNRHVSVFVNDAEYSGMEDNDLRGFLNGDFKNGWNQPGQIHVRVGRRAQFPKWGEHELWRVLQRWSDIDLPENTRVINARLILEVEETLPIPVELHIYEVNKDWNPGRGGVLKDNTSPPCPGEVWWNDVAYQQRSWSLPAGGFASEDHPDADTPAMPLAAASYRSGAKHVEFSSPRLRDYITRRLSERQPLLFLLKLSDYLEDTSSTRLNFYSGNHGDSRNSKRRPRLILEWESPGESFHLEKDVFLDYGRNYRLDRLETVEGRHFCVSFNSLPGYEAPTIEVRGGTAESTGPWRRASLPFSVDWEWIDVRLAAVHDPHILGQDFEVTFRNTWVTTALPGEQKVKWRFQSPSGEVYESLARFEGEYRWRVRFTPEEIGRWRYVWTQTFSSDEPYPSAVGVFDVVGGDRENVERQLQALLVRIRDSELESPRQRRDAFEVAFRRLQRAMIQLHTPDSCASWFDKQNQIVRKIRELLGGQAVPETIPLRAYPRKK